LSESLNRRFRIYLSFFIGIATLSALFLTPTVLMFAAGEPVITSTQTTATAQNWWDTKWQFRVPIAVDAAGYARSNKPVDVAIDFSDLLSKLGVSGTINQDSLYLHEVDATGLVIKANVPFQYDPPSNPAYSGSLTILMEGTTAANTQKRYHLYFDLEGAGSFTPQSVTPLVFLTDNVTDAGLASYKIQTNETTYYYHKQGGGFSSLVDKDNLDWISYSSDLGSAGVYRGIPNMVYPSDGGYFHPGNTGVVSSILSKGPLKVVIYSETADKAWQTLWEIYPEYARLTVLKAATYYWFLYEGTPGGILETTSDFIVRPDGTMTLAETSWKGDLSPEWLFFSDPTSGRSLYFAHHQDDAIVDSYRPMNDEMTVFGFGRDLSSRFLSQTPSHFTMGFKDSVELAAMSNTINSAYRDVAVTLSAPESQAPYSLTIDKQGSGQVTVNPDKAEYAYGEQAELQAIASPGWAFSKWIGSLTGVDPNPTIVFKSDKKITAVFEEMYELTINIDGGGDVTTNPEKAFYFNGDEITLQAVANPGWKFKEWSGDLVGTNPNPTIIVTKDTQITAVFEQKQYTLTVTTLGDGLVTIDPPKAAYLYKDKVILEAVENPGWIFKEWQGDLTGGDQKSEIEIVDDMQITAVFEKNQYSLTMQISGLGSVSKSPDKQSYVYGEQVVLEASPEDGWIFKGWGGDVSGSDLTVLLTMTDNFTVYAQFEELKYYVPLIIAE
jgi:hypothetical protein